MPFTRVYDLANPVQELSGTTPTANLLTGGLDEYFTRTDTNGTANFLTDALGSTESLADTTGTIQTQYAFEPFGNVTQSGASSANSFTYTGRENDGIALYYYRTRYYSPQLSRFISEDRIRFLSKDTNLYRYTWDSPANFTDPTGTAGVGVVATGGYYGGAQTGSGAGFAQGVNGTVGGMYFPNPSNPMGFTSGGYASAGIYNGPDSGAFGNNQNNATYGGSAGIGLGLDLTNANSIQDLAGPFYNTEISLGPFTINVAFGDNGVVNVTATAGLGFGLGVANYCTDTWTNPVAPTADMAGRSCGCHEWN
jgi:RHS repeat-associated protein